VLRRHLVIVAAVAIAVGVVSAVVWQMARPAPGIEKKAIGSWRETDSDEAYQLTIAPDIFENDKGRYTVSYPRSFLQPHPAGLSGDEIHIWGENGDDVVWVVKYKAANDTLIVTRKVTGERHALRRVSD